MTDGELLETRSAPQRLRQRPLPSWIPPMLATLTEDFPTEGKWVYEPKLDGVRALIYASRGTVRMYSRNRKPLNDAYPELVDALTPSVRGEAILDGEIVAFDSERGITSFSRLQQRMQLRDAVRARRSQVAVHLYLFDCLYYEGVDLTGLPLLERKGSPEGRRLVSTIPSGLPPTRPAAAWPCSGCLRTGCRRNHCQAGHQPVCQHSFDRLAQAQVFAPAGIRYRRLYRATRVPRAAWCVAAGILRWQCAALRRKGRYRLRSEDARHAHRRLEPLHRLTSPFSKGPDAGG